MSAPPFKTYRQPTPRGLCHRGRMCVGGCGSDLWLPADQRLLAPQKKTERSKGAPFASFCFSLLNRNVQLFAVVLVGNGQLLAAVCAAGSEDSASVLCGHALAESMLVHAATVVRLKCSFHLLIFIVIL